MWPSWHNFQWSHPTSQQRVGSESLTQDLKNILTVVEWVLASHACKAFALLPYMPYIHTFLWKQHVSDDRGTLILSKLKCKKCTRVESKERPPGGSIEAFTMHAAMESEKQKLCWRENWQEMWRTVRKIFFRYNSKMKTKEKSGWLEKVPDDLEKWVIFRKVKEENWGLCSHWKGVVQCCKALRVSTHDLCQERHSL